MEGRPRLRMVFEAGVPDDVYPVSTLQVTAEGDLHSSSSTLVLVSSEGVVELEAEGPAPGGPWLNWPTGETPRPTAPGKAPLAALVQFPVTEL